MSVDVAEGYRGRLAWVGGERRRPTGRLSADVAGALAALAAITTPAPAMLRGRRFPAQTLDPA